MVLLIPLYPPRCPDLALRTPFFRQLWGRVSPYALQKVAEQHSKVTVTATVLPECTGAFTTTMGLLCSHKILERLGNEDTLALEDIHCHWHLEQASLDPSPIDPRLLVVDSLVIHP